MCLRVCVAGLAMNEIVLCQPVNDFVRFTRYVWQDLNSGPELLAIYKYFYLITMRAFIDFKSLDSQVPQLPQTRSESIDH